MRETKVGNIEIIVDPEPEMLVMDDRDDDWPEGFDKKCSEAEFRETISRYMFSRQSEMNYQSPRRTASLHDLPIGYGSSNTEMIFVDGGDGSWGEKQHWDGCNIDPLASDKYCKHGTWSCISNHEPGRARKIYNRLKRFLSCAAQ